MPYRFRFASHDGQQAFACPVQCQRCSGTTRAGNQCSRRTCIGTPKCWQHLLNEGKLRIKASTVPGAGKGLFAMDRRAAQQAVIFRPGDIVVDYGGAATTAAVLQARYGNYTAPYGLHVSGARFENAACKRGAGALANHGPPARANARYSYTAAGGGGRRGVLRATKVIKNNSEVLVNYGDDYLFNEPTTHVTR